MALQNAPRTEAGKASEASPRRRLDIAPADVMPPNIVVDHEDERAHVAASLAA
jgi:hypothetical protein